VIDVNSDPLRRTVKRGTNRSTGPPRSRSATHNSKPTKKLDHPHIRHKSATMTLDLYGHLFADQLDEVADAMDAARTSAQDRADFLRTNGADVYELSRERITGGQ